MVNNLIIKNEKDRILSDDDINELRSIYQNNAISSEYISLDVKSIMINQGFNKAQAINHILKILK